MGWGGGGTEKRQLCKYFYLKTKKPFKNMFWKLETFDLRDPLYTTHFFRWSIFFKWFHESDTFDRFLAEWF